MISEINQLTGVFVAITKNNLPRLFLIPFNTSFHCFHFSTIMDRFS